MLLLLLLLGAVAHAADWDRFRGPNGAGTSGATGLPTEFSPEKNVAWKATVPFGRSSPIVAGGRVFLTATEGDSLVTLAFDAATGHPAWRREIKRPRQQKIYKANDPASPTPAADSKSVFAFFPDFGIAAYGFDGKERWRQPLGPFENFYGIASSPVVANGAVYLVCDQAHDSFLLALDAASGRERWRTNRPVTDGWSVPIVHGDRILVFGTTRVDAYFLATGEQAWWIPIASNGSMGSPLIYRDSVIVTADGSDQPWMPSFESTLAKLDKNGDKQLSEAECKDEKEWFEHFGWVDSNHDKMLTAVEWNTARSLGQGDYGVLSISLDGKGQLPPSSVRWRFKRNLPYIPAPLIYDGVFYMVKDGGIVTSLDPATGAVHKQGRAEKALGPYFASPVAADGKVFLLNEEGKLSVLKAGAQWELLAMNDLGEECYATPAISDAKLFVRTRGTLYAFASR
ncbi:MAG: PQQ-binding-like beta-propeller repeat protein [Bryobacteraceae bacterium]